MLTGIARRKDRHEHAQRMVDAGVRISGVERQNGRESNKIATRSMLLAWQGGDLLQPLASHQPQARGNEREHSRG